LLWVLPLMLEEALVGLLDSREEEEKEEAR
jgi:hypothetical protein